MRRSSHRRIPANAAARPARSRRDRLEERAITETLEAVDRFAPDFTEGMADDEQAGPAKEIVMALRAAGIDLADKSAVQHWIDERNETLRLGRDGLDSRAMLRGRLPW